MECTGALITISFHSYQRGYLQLSLSSKYCKFVMFNAYKDATLQEMSLYIGIYRDIDDNQLTELPAGIFESLTQLQEL